MALVADVRDFLQWWWNELAGSVPSSVRRGPGRASRPKVTLGIARDGISVTASSAAAAPGMPMPETADLAEQLSEIAGKSAHGIAVIVEPGRYLERRLAPFRLPARRARSMALLDVASSTPLDVSDIVTLFPVDDPEPGARAFLVKKSVLLPVLRAIEQASGRLESLAVRVDGDLLALDPKDISGPASRPGRWLSRLVAAGSLLLAGTIAATVAHAHWRQGVALAELDAVVGKLDAEVREVRVLSDRRDRRLQQIEAARQQKNDAIPVILVWEELTRVLPDSAWVTDLTVSDDRLTFAGFSTAAARLLPLIEESPLFSQPAFASPVVKSPASGAERFTIEAEIVR